MSKKVSLSKLRGYKEPDEHAYINVNDRDLQKFRIDLPIIEDVQQIENYGLPAEDQMFVREQKPLKLDYLEKDLRKELRSRSDLKSYNMQEQAFSEEIWNRLYKNYEKYRAEIEWIRSQWYYRLYGKWYFINGKPTYLNGWNWFYLNYWNLEQVGLPEYRDRDRRWFLAQNYLYETTDAPKKNRNGELVYRSDGSILMEDVGIKTIYGSNNVKARQIGETSRTECINCEIVTKIPEGRGGIQAENDKQSAWTFKYKLLGPFKKLPFFFKPTVKEIDPGSRLEFSSKNPDYGINASIDYATTVYRDFYDGENLNFLHVDEAGKLDKRESVKDRHEVLYKCMVVLGGFMMYTSTVEDMAESAGKEYLSLTKNSHIERRDETKQTLSGLANVFFPSQDGHKFFIGKFGESIIDKPTKEQVPYLKKKLKDRNGDYMGAKEYLLSKRREYEKQGDMNGLIGEKRMEPMSFREAFTPPSQSEYFNRNIIETRLGDLQMNPPQEVIRGNFIWVGNPFSNMVRFREDKNGRWVVSKRLKDNEVNRVIKKGGVFFPNNGFKYIVAPDAFKAEKTEGGKMSDGGAAIFEVWDRTIDDESKDVANYETHQFRCTYLFRPKTVNEFVEDMLKMCIYYGAWCYPENNVNHVEEKLREWGYGGYLLYGFNEQTGKRNKVPGFTTNWSTKPKLFNRGRDWIENHGDKCKHPEILSEFSEIRGMDDLTNYDLLTSVMGALYGEDILLEMNKVDMGHTGFDLGGVMPLKYF